MGGVLAASWYVFGVWGVCGVDGQLWSLWQVVVWCGGVCEGDQGGQVMFGACGEFMSWWGCMYESPSPCGPAGAVSFGSRVEGHTRGCSRDCEYMKTPRSGDVC